MPKISIIVPVYGVEPYFHRCVDSILRQTFTDFELILIDDGSPDRCPAFCDEYAARDKRITVIHQENRGLSAARNAGIDLAMTHDSQWISFVDSDDWISEKYLEALYSAAQGYGIATAAHKRTNGVELPEVTTVAPSIKSPEDLMECESFYFSVARGKLYMKSMFSSLRFPVGRIYEDEFVIYRILFQYSAIPFIAEPLYAYFLNPEGIIRSSWTEKRLDALDALEQQIAYYVKNRYLAVARKRFCAYLKRYRDCKLEFERYTDISAHEKRRLLRKMNRQLQWMLIRYHKYRWCSFWNRGDDLWIWSNTFPLFHAVHMVWRWGKSLFIR